MVSVCFCHYMYPFKCFLFAALYTRHAHMNVPTIMLPSKKYPANFYATKNAKQKHEIT